MEKPQELFQGSPLSTGMTARQFHILHSPKCNGTASADSKKYLLTLGVKIVDNPQPIQFLPNTDEPVHRWSPYVQGFSASFVQRTLTKYKAKYKTPKVLDPFAGCGTVMVQAKLQGIPSLGLELNPLLKFIAETKLNSWMVNPDALSKIVRSLVTNHKSEAPEFLKSNQHFNPGVLNNLERIKGGIDYFTPATEEEKPIKDLMNLAFAAILVDCSNLKRSPCLGYSRNKFVHDSVPFRLFNSKISEIAQDLRLLQTRFVDSMKTYAKMKLADSTSYQYRDCYDLVVTSPPYMNGLDYVMNYKIEMGWLGFAQNHKELKKVKDNLVVCDNVSKGLIREFASKDDRYSNDWIENIKDQVYGNILRRGAYRRPDMPEIIHKYFDDLHKVIQNISLALNRGGRFILVVGDSLIADVYVPTDLILARIGRELGFTIERIEKARERRSGQIRTYKLRETIITLLKEF